MANNENHVPVRLDNVTLAHRENEVLQDVTFTLERGEFVYLIGKTGSGKSSLLKAIYGEMPLAKGEGEVCGFNLNSLRQSKIPFLRRKLGIVFQDFELLTDRSVNDNLAFVLKATEWKDKQEIKARQEEVLEQVGLSTKGYKMPHQLSGGEQQRVAIARALLNHPELILADEPTGNLDPVTTDGILNLLLEISKTGTSVIMATHDYSSMSKFSSRTLVCKDGRLEDSQAVTQTA
jgi:cell division transport system ATP-binding protein